MKRIAFHSNQLSITGTEIALFDYAINNQDLLGNRSLILFNATHPANRPEALEKFSARFDVLSYRDPAEIDGLLAHAGADLMYTIKSGKRDGIISNIVPTMVHAVFPTHPGQRHGASYAFISEWLSLHCSNHSIPCVPHIVGLPDEDADLRAELGLPTDALVIGCFGGSQSFNVPSAIEAVKRLLEHESMRFIFMNIAAFVDHPRAIFLPGSTDMSFKTKFINSCDAMLHARKLGESFGLACAEFSIRNKPVMSWAHTKHWHQQDVLGTKGFYYSDADSLCRMIQSMDRVALEQQNWDCYSARYNKAVVMEKFDRYLIQPALANPNKSRPQLNCGQSAAWPYYALKAKMFYLSKRYG
jgi:hypothetical protein